MSKQLDITANGDLHERPGQDSIVDIETGYPIQIWELKTMIPGRRAFLLRYWRVGRWWRGSAPMLDRNMRRFGLGRLTVCPWGLGPEVTLSIDDRFDVFNQVELDLQESSSTTEGRG